MKKLYNGSVEIGFEPLKHKYTVNGKAGTISVTAVTRVIDKSNALMNWAVKMMSEYLKENVEQLAKTKDVIKILELIETAKSQHRIKKQTAADLGTQIHEWAEQFIKAKTKDEILPLPKDPRVYNGANAFLKWATDYNVKFISSERIVYSKKYKYVGTMDAEAIINGKKCVIDFKSSTGIYPEMKAQVAAYRLAAEEEGSEYTGNNIIVRFDKEDGSFEVVDLPDYEADKKAFLSCLTLTNWLKK